MENLLQSLTSTNRSLLLAATSCLLFLLLGKTATAQLTVTLQTQSPMCGGFATGSITANVSGGTAPYTYQWSNGMTGNPITNLPTGTYMVTVTSSTGSTGTASATLTSPPPLNVVITVTNCAIPGTMTANVTGGVPPYMYMWSNGGTTPTISNLPPGEYCVSIMDSNNCGYILCESITIPLSVTVNATPVVCGNLVGGTATAEPTNGDPPFTYLWNTGATTQSIMDLGPGLYTVTVTGGNGCSAVGSGNVTLASGNFSVDLNAIQPTCFGTSNGSIASIVNGGADPLTFAWSSGQTTQNIFNLGPGQYSLTVTDKFGCTATNAVTLAHQSNLSAVLATTNPTCVGANNGSITVTANNGVLPYSYLWSNGGTTPTNSNLPPGTYTVTVTDNINCTVSAPATLMAPPAFNLSVTATNASHCGATDGSVLAVPGSGGNPPFTYLWNNGATSAGQTGLGAGTYTVTVTSAQGCTASASATVTEPQFLNVNISGSSVKCHGASTGNITVLASGGAPPLGFLWSNGATTQNLTNIAAGSYTLTVTDNVGCSRVQSITVTQPAQLGITFNSTGSCGSTGTATAVITGGVSPYNYMWDNGQNTATIVNLAPGNYEVTATDANNCTVTGTVNVPAFPPFSLAVNATNTSCNGANDGTATAVLNGGQDPFQYLWNTGATTFALNNLEPGTYSVTVTDGNGCTQTGAAAVTAGPALDMTINAQEYICPGETGTATANASGGTPPYTWSWSNGQTTQTATDLAPGTYTVTATDPSGCFGTATVTILPGGTYNISQNVLNVSCFNQNNGSIVLNVNGGVPPYTYLWNTGATTPSIGSLSPGSYSVTVSDGSGCSSVQTYPITEPDLLTTGLSFASGDCNTPSLASAAPSGGTQPYSYLWSNGATTPSVTGLPPGNYSLTVTDANGCTATGTFVIQGIPMPTCSVTLVQAISAIGGNDGQLTASVTSGTSPFQFAWSSGQTTQTISGLGAGTYTVSVTDANGCVTTCSFILYDPAKVGDFVWLDANENGIQDPGETGLDGVTVKIGGTDVYGNTVNLTATSGPNGMYMFLVNPGNYKITFTTPGGFLPSPANQGSDDSLDSDPNPLTGMTPTFTLAGSEINLTIDAGYYPAPPCENVTVPGTICCDQTLCGPGNIPAPLMQTAPPLGGIGALEFMWMYTTVPGPFDPNGWTLAPNSNTPDYAPGPIYQTTYFIRCVRRENCIEFLESNIVTITVDTVAVAQITGPEGGCVNDPLMYTAYNNGPGATYLWNFGDGVPATSTAQSVSVTWSTFGLKTVTLTVTRNGCTSTAVLLVYITNLPTFCGNALIIEAEAVNQTTVALNWFYEKPFGATHDFQVEWSSDGSGFVPVGTEIRAEEMGDFLHYTATHDGAVRGWNYYRVKLEDGSGNALLSNVAVVTMAGDFKFVHVYPNPFTDKLTVEVIERFGEMPISLELVSVEGRLLESYLAPAQGFIMEIPTAHLPGGMYFLFVKYDGKPQKIFKLAKR